MAKVPTCRSCNAPVRWAKTTKGKLIPLDPSPVPGGKFGLVLQGDDSPPLAVAAQDHHQLRYDTHFATCPHARSHRTR